MEIDDWLAAHGRSRRGGRKEKYNWDLYFDGNLHVLEYEKDFKPKPGVFHSTVYVAAKRRGIKVRIAVVGDKVAIQRERE